MSYYLDSNAHTNLNLLQSQIININNEIGIHGNPLASNFIGRAAANLIEKSREKIAELLGAEDSTNIIFTNSCTESNYWATLMLSNYCITKNFYLKNEPPDPIINVSPYEHRSLDDCLVLLPYEKQYVKLDKNGMINKIQQNDHSIFIGVQNEIGLIADFDNIRKHTNSIFMSDLAQAIGKTPINLKNMGVDIATFGAHKFGGPSGIGIIYFKNPEMWCPLNNCKSYRYDVPGSMNVLGICQAAIAMENTIKNMKEDMDRAKSFQNELENRLIDMGFEIIGKGGNRVSTITFAKVPNDINNLDLLLDLEDYDIYIGLGSACGGRIEQPSKSVAALEYKNPMTTEFIRISQDGRYGLNDAIFVCDKIYNIIKRK